MISGLSHQGKFTARSIGKSLALFERMFKTGGTDLTLSPLQLSGVLRPAFITEFLEDLLIPNKTCPPAEAAPGRYTVYRLVDNMPLKKDGVLLSTPGRTGKSHHSWWISKEFDFDET
jgi:hypothetical protein